MASLTVSPVAARNALKRDLRGDPLHSTMYRTEMDLYILHKVACAMFSMPDGCIDTGSRVCWIDTLNL